jgi:predicted transcriptional regulator
MRAREIVSLINGKVLSGESLLDEVEIKRGFAADLLSDLLALVEVENRDVVLITGITNPQIVRAAVLMDIPMVIVARGKHVPWETISLGEEKGVILVSTELIVFVTCGLLYQAGIQGAKIVRGP